MILNMHSTKAVKGKSSKIRRGPIPDHQTRSNMNIYIVRSWRSMIIKSIPKINTEENKDLTKHLYNCVNHTYIPKIPKPIICTTPYKLTTRTTELEQFGASSKEFHESPRMTHAAGTRDQHLQQEMNQSRKPTKNKEKTSPEEFPLSCQVFFYTGTIQVLIRLQ